MNHFSLSLAESEAFAGMKLFSWLSARLTCLKNAYKAKNCGQTNFWFLKTYFQRSVVNDEILYTVLPETNKKIFQTKHCVKHRQVSSIVCEVNRTVFFYKYYKRLKRKIKTPQVTFIKTNQLKYTKNTTSNLCLYNMHK